MHMKQRENLTLDQEPLTQRDFYHVPLQFTSSTRSYYFLSGFSLRIVVAGEQCKSTGELL